MLFLWDDSLTIDDGDIDRDHKFLFALTNRILSAAEINVDKQVLAKLLNEYIDYTAIHFDHEERLMNKLSYPDKDSHILAHNSFFDRLCLLKTAFEQNDVSIRNKINAFFATYAFNHIATCDRALAEWCGQHRSHDGALPCPPPDRAAG